MPGTIHLDIVTPEKLELTAEVDMVVLPGSEGELGVLPGHAPLITSLLPGVLRVFEDNMAKQVHLAVSQGFVEIKDNRVIVLADAAELPDEIDLARAEKAKKRAEDHLTHRGNPDEDAARAELALKRAIARMKVGALSKNI